MHSNSLKGVPFCVAVVSTGWKKEKRVSFSREHVNSLFSKTFSLALGATKDFIWWVMVPYFPGVKRPVHEAEH